MTRTPDTAATSLSARNLHRTYRSGSQLVQAVNGISLDLAVGEVLALMGPSGSGKSSLLALLGGLDAPSEGTVTVRGQDWRALTGRRRAAFRRDTCGYVFQNLALLPAATAAENIEIPLLLAHIPAAERHMRVAEMLDAVDMTDHANYLPDQLSGGQQQRVGIARALVHRPALVFADEPTGSLDSVNAEDVTRILVATASDQGTGVILVTHDPNVAAHAHRILHLHSGHLAEPGTLATTSPVGP